MSALTKQLLQLSFQDPVPTCLAASFLFFLFILPVGLPRFFIFSYFFFFVLYRLLFPLAWRILVAALVPSFFLGCLLPLFGAGHPV